ncbi:MAG: GIY-YIG nuclease family protein [Fidelibacterota bacterium]
MYFTYILFSQSLNKYYVGYTSDLNSRLDHHNRGASRYTRRGVPWKIVYVEKYAQKNDAIVRERDIKKKKSRKYIEQLILGNHHADEKGAKKDDQKNKNH